MPLTAEPELRAETRKRLLNPFADQGEVRKNVFGDDDAALSQRIDTASSRLNFDPAAERTARTNIIDRASDSNFDRLARTFSLDPGGLRQGRAIRIGGTLGAADLNARDALEAELSQRTQSENRANATTLGNLQAQGRNANLQLGNLSLNNTQAGADFITDRERSQLVSRELDSKRNQNIIGGVFQGGKLLNDLLDRDPTTTDPTQTTTPTQTTDPTQTTTPTQTTDPTTTTSPFTQNPDGTSTFNFDTGADGNPVVYQFPTGAGQGRQLPDGRIMNEAGAIFNPTTARWETENGEPLPLDEQGQPILPEPFEELTQNNLVGLAESFGTQAGDAGYDRRFDFNGDGEIGFFDLLDATSRLNAPLTDPTVIQQLRDLGVDLSGPQFDAPAGNVDGPVVYDPATNPDWFTNPDPPAGSAAETVQNWDWENFPTEGISLATLGSIDPETRIALENLVGSRAKNPGQLLTPEAILRGLEANTINLSTLEQFFQAHPDFDLQDGKVGRTGGGGGFLAGIGQWAVAALTNMGNDVIFDGQNHVSQTGESRGTVNLDLVPTDNDAPTNVETTAARRPAAQDRTVAPETARARPAAVQAPVPEKRAAMSLSESRALKNRALAEFPQLRREILSGRFGPHELIDLLNGGA